MVSESVPREKEEDLDGEPLLAARAFTKCNFIAHSTRGNLGTNGSLAPAAQVRLEYIRRGRIAEPQWLPIVEIWGGGPEFPADPVPQHYGPTTDGTPSQMKMQS